jgi:GAF domain-containing protein
VLGHVLRLGARDAAELSSPLEARWSALDPSRTYPRARCGSALPRHCHALCRGIALLPGRFPAVRRASSGIRLAPISAVGNRPFKGWLAAPLTAPDGSELGAIQLFDNQGGSFTEGDEAVLVHHAQTALAAVERACLYQEHR